MCLISMKLIVFNCAVESSSTLSVSIGIVSIEGMTCLLFRLIFKDKYVSFFCAWIPCYFVLLLGSLFKARTLCTSTKALTAQFEHTILITDVGHEAGRNVLEKGALLVRGDSRMQPKKSVCIFTYVLCTNMFP